MTVTPDVNVAVALFGANNKFPEELQPFVLFTEIVVEVLVKLLVNVEPK